MRNFLRTVLPLGQNLNPIGNEMRNLIHKYFGGYRPQHYSVLGGIIKALY